MKVTEGAAPVICKDVMSPSTWAGHTRERAFGRFTHPDGQLAFLRTSECDVPAIGRDRSTDSSSVGGQFRDLHRLEGRRPCKTQICKGGKPAAITRTTASAKPFAL